ncbi:hypothetical protein [Blastomonas sp. CACIA14H2]|uniref:hypothetical protein n=1 Tax=unclassified Blastomonas TaxID=2626550 RepID=UPI001300888A
MAFDKLRLSGGCGGWPSMGKTNRSANDAISGFGVMMHNAAMKVTIYEADTPIGEAEIFALDPPMGVAMAKFKSLSAYDVERHANVVDGDYIEDRGRGLRIEMSDGVPLISQAISIQAWPALGEHEVHILGILQPSFETLFCEHPDFKSHWGKP